MTTTTDLGVADTEIGGLDQTAESFLARLLPKKEEEDASKKPSEQTDETKNTENEPEETNEAEETSDESPEGTEGNEGSEETEEQSEKKYVESDDVFVKVKVGDQELEVPVKDLKRLHGQEASLTRKSQEVADLRKKVETDAQRHAAGLDVMVKLASSRADEFRKINFLALTKDPNVDAQQLSILQEEARRAFDQEKFFKEELGSYVDAMNRQQQESLASQAAQSVKTLTDKESPLYIEGFNQKTYDDMRTFAIGEGLDAGIANNLVDPAAIKLLHMAMSYKKGLANVNVQRVNKTAKKITKTTNSSVPPSPKIEKQKKAMSTHKNKGSVDTAAEAFLANWASSADNE
jgi:hypothetical protein